MLIQLQFCLDHTLSFRDIDFDANNQIGVLDYSVDVYHLPDSRLKKTFYENDPELTHSQSFAGFEVHLTRKPNKYLQNYFVPSGLLVVISWVGILKKDYYLTNVISSQIVSNFNIRYCFRLVL